MLFDLSDGYSQRPLSAVSTCGHIAEGMEEGVRDYLPATSFPSVSSQDRQHHLCGIIGLMNLKIMVFEKGKLDRIYLPAASL